ncbi:hypothetical protein BDV95DRAFT_506594 [Massariosphaeria phaeospora]|uniref:Thaumatin n=1 Tax=Massariosphaeria phaeospora TaxID=100035 RepID=A0A7C8M7C9_9PLEO|nr:hypothetical protein BDV95DRAFT_506594 [Massariosphaeria phaeospora]
MLSKIVFALAAFQATLTSATLREFLHTVSGSVQEEPLGKLVFSNRCPYDLWVDSVDQGWESGLFSVPARSQHVEDLRKPDIHKCPTDDCGTSFKVSKTPQITRGSHTQFEYAIKHGMMYYDISFVDCAQGSSADTCPGHDKGLSITSDDTRCTIPLCQPGQYCPTEAYYVPQPLKTLGIPEPVKGCGDAGTGMTIYMTACSSEPALSARSVAGRAIMLDGNMA